MNTHVLYDRRSENPLRKWFGSLKLMVVQGAKIVVFAAKIHRERKQLLNLSDEALKDMGISRCDAIREANKGLLDLPDGNRH